MPSSHAFRTVAWFNVVCGVLVGAWGAVTVAGLFAARARETLLMDAVVVAVMLIIAAVMSLTAIAHLRGPTRKTALALAANTAVIVWLVAGTLLDSLGIPRLSGAPATLMAVIIAYLGHRFILKPAALRAFPEDATGSRTPASDR